MYYHFGVAWNHNTIFILYQITYTYFAVYLQRLMGGLFFLFAFNVIKTLVFPHHLNEKSPVAIFYRVHMFFNPSMNPGNTIVHTKTLIILNFFSSYIILIFRLDSSC